MSLTLNLEGIQNFINWEDEVQKIQPKVSQIHNELHQNIELQKKYLGWLKLPLDTNIQKDIERIKKIKNKNNDLDVLVVIGIGGSYLGAKAVIESLKKPFPKNKPEILFAGNQVSGNYLANLIRYLKNKTWAINVISKSGTTLEPALSFRVLEKEIENKYSLEKAKDYIYVTTDSENGILLKIAKKKGYETFFIPDSIGGRFSVLTVVGILPFVFADLNVEEILKGSLQGYQDTLTNNIKENLAYQYAVARFLLHTKLNKKIELLVSYEPHLSFFAEWWKQLFAESEGKENKGLFVSAINNSTDLHSLGQFIQEGSKIMFETILNAHDNNDDYIIPKIENELDNLNYLAGQSFSDINQKIMKATKQAHIEGEIPNIEICIPQIDAYNLGYIIYFFEKACAVSGFLLDINPFDQPGVEIYKKKMLSLLNK
ncbi:glucose-6-phosphate isomerase ['Camptotheca acuminata' phytoplasma]|uniref:glucose-6-phosphate isomerase n=1 Tax='Camptotheca acuminata' phytoplasma TaxID=3239192 RepID=UPI003519DF4C